MERTLVENYIALLDEIVGQLNADDHAAAVDLASVPDEIRGYGHVKQKSLAAAKALQEVRLQTFHDAKSIVQIKTAWSCLANLVVTS